MSTSTLDRPALQAVFTPRDAEEVADYVARGRQRRRWARFLTAKNALLSLVGKARRFAAQVIQQYRLGGAVQAVKTTLGWLAGGYRLLRRGLEIVGMTSAVGMVIASPTIRNFAARAGAAVVSVVNRVTTTFGRAARTFLGWFGSPGCTVAGWFSRTVSTVTDKVSRVVKPVFVGLRTALDVTSLPVRTLGTIARERAVARLLGSLLPQPWATIARIVAGAMLLPDAIKREGLRLLLDGLAGLLNRQSTAGDGERASQRTVRPVRVQPPAAWPTPTASTGPEAKPDRKPGVGQEDLFGEAPFDVVLEAELDATEGPLPRRVRPTGRPNNRKSGPRR